MAKIATLNNIGDGLAGDLFQHELTKVLDNIADPRTSATAAREITITIKIKPDNEREVGEAEIKTKTKLAPTAGKKALLFFARDDDGNVKMTTSNPHQEELGLDFAKKQEELGR